MFGVRAPSLEFDRRQHKSYRFNGQMQIALSKYSVFIIAKCGEKDLLQIEKLAVQRLATLDSNVN